MHSIDLYCNMLGSVTCHKTSIPNLGRKSIRKNNFLQKSLTLFKFWGKLGYVVPKWWIWVINWACGGVSVKFSVVCACSGRGTHLRKKATSTHFSTLLVHYFACGSWKPKNRKPEARCSGAWMQMGYVFVKRQHFPSTTVWLQVYLMCLLL